MQAKQKHLRVSAGCWPQYLQLYEYECPPDTRHWHQQMFFLPTVTTVFVPFPRVSGKKSTKRTKSINGPLYVFRGRINTEVMEVENVEDGTGLCLPSSVTLRDRLYAINHLSLPEYLLNHFSRGSCYV